MTDAPRPPSCEGTGQFVPPEMKLWDQHGNHCGSLCPVCRHAIRVNIRTDRITPHPALAWYRSQIRVVK